MPKVLKVTLVVTLDELPQSEREEIADLEEVKVEELPGLAEVDPMEFGHLFMFNDMDETALSVMLFEGSGMYARVTDIECTDVEEVATP